MDEELQRSLGQIARAARERLGLTQAQVAKKVGLVTGVYGRLERGDMMPSVPSLRRISAVLGISTDALLGMSASQVSATAGDSAPEPHLSPELRNILHQLRPWPSKHVKVLSRVLTVLASTLEE